jgi:2'-5' RNA ligase superfamily protein
MVAALEVYFDPTSTSRLRKLWDAMEDAGIPSLRDLTHGRHRPHLSLVAAPVFDVGPVRAALAGVDLAPPMTLKLDHIGVFPGRVLWLGPAPRHDLLDHQAAVFRRLDAAGLPLDPYYRPGEWVPHVTVSMRVPHKHMTEAIKLCMDVLPIELTVTGGAIADHARDVYQPW